MTKQVDRFPEFNLHDAVESIVGYSSIVDVQKETKQQQNCMIKY